MVLNALIKQEDSLWVAHCLELDVVATGTSLENVQAELSGLIAAQVSYAFSNNNLSNLYRAAPAGVWEEFYKLNNPFKFN